MGNREEPDHVLRRSTLLDELGPDCEGLRAHAWSSASLDTPERWPEPLKAAAQLLLGAATPAAIFWGSDLVELSNDPWLRLLGAGGLGAPRAPSSSFADAAQRQIGAVLEDVQRTGHASGVRVELETAGLGAPALVEAHVIPLGVGRAGSAGVYASLRATPPEEDTRTRAPRSLAAPARTTHLVAEQSESDDMDRDPFLNALAFELRNPLAPISTGAAILKRQGSIDPALRAAGDMIERQVQHLTQLIDDLLDVAQIDHGTLCIHREPVALSDLVEQAVNAVRPTASSMGHTLDVALPGATVTVEVDAKRLVHVLTKLLHNACKFTPSPGSIRLRAMLEREEVVIEIRDPGVGIDAEHLPRIFEIRRPSSVSHQAFGSGLGIGLAFAQGVVEQHGGRLVATSAGRGQGSTFQVRLPRYQPGIAPRPADARRSPQTAVRRRILIADDNPEVLGSFALLLRLEGHIVERAHDGLEALDIAARTRPDIVLLDLGMPRLDGYETCRRMREQPWGKRAKIIAVTGWGRAEEQEEVAKRGFDAHVIKPVELATLRKLLA